MEDINIQNTLLFLGSVRTGHTLISSILANHKNIVMGLENNIPLKLIIEEKELDEIYKNIIDENNVSDVWDKGGYEYEIKNIEKDIKIIGDSMCGFKYMNLLNEFYFEINEKIDNIKWISVFRNPFDVVISSHIMNEHSIQDIINDFILTTNIQDIIIKENKDNHMCIFLEEFINDFKNQIDKILLFLDIQNTNDEYYNDNEKNVNDQNKYRYEKYFNDKDLYILNDFLMEHKILKRYHI